MIHLHLTSLVLAIILFIITYNSIDRPDGESKYSKALHMVLRLIYLIILFTGLMLFLDFSSGDQMMYGLKFLAGLITIGLMEMALIKQRKKGTGRNLVIALVIFLIVTIALGIYLPAGPLSAMFA
ncbi:YisL family protein [Salinicoccus sp. RF5]|uniref:YisL family protein n=1 Tax=Salinicoccus sp. RF5 TaxID=2748874 RepID=UPI001E5647F1|nr:YisL family protein [Salinicoccus sp. RF5]MCC4722479.1 YisL family protein [Salinicoccus sp. RF5]